MALVGLLAVLLIPIGTSSLRGLTHVLTCNERSATPFSLEVPADGPPIISSSTVIERDADGEEVGRQVCGGLTLDLLVGSREEDRAEVTVAITNSTDFGWHGSVQLLFDGTPIPLDIGKIGAGATVTDTFELRLDEGRTYEIEGNLLIGP